MRKGVRQFLIRFECLLKSLGIPVPACCPIIERSLNNEHSVSSYILRDYLSVESSRLLNNSLLCVDYYERSRESRGGKCAEIKSWKNIGMSCCVHYSTLRLYGVVNLVCEIIMTLCNLLNSKVRQLRFHQLN